MPCADPRHVDSRLSMPPTSIIGQRGPSDACPAFRVNRVAIHVKASPRPPEAAAPACPTIGPILGSGLAVVTGCAHAGQAGQGRERVTSRVDSLVMVYDFRNLDDATRTARLTDWAFHQLGYAQPLPLSRVIRPSAHEGRAAPLQAAEAVGRTLTTLTGIGCRCLCPRLSRLLCANTCLLIWLYFIAPPPIHRVQRTQPDHAASAAPAPR